MVMAVVLPCLASAKTSGSHLTELPAINLGSLADSTVNKQHVKPADKKPDDNKPDLNKPDIKEVPRSRHQFKPLPVKARIKIPVKIIKPVIRRPFGLIRKNFR